MNEREKRNMFFRFSFAIFMIIALYNSFEAMTRDLLTALWNFPEALLALCYIAFAIKGDEK